jgi:hypothetical protein
MARICTDEIFGNNRSRYSAQDKSRCSGFVTTGGAPSYVELLTCLEMAKQAKELRERKSRARRLVADLELGMLVDALDFDHVRKPPQT